MDMFFGNRKRKNYDEFHNLYESLLDDVDIDEVEDKDDEDDYEHNVRIVVFIRYKSSSYSDELPKELETVESNYLKSIIANNSIYDFVIDDCGTKDMRLTIHIDLDEKGFYVLCNFLLYTLCFLKKRIGNFDIELKKSDTTVFVVEDKKTSNSYYSYDATEFVRFRKVDKFASTFYNIDEDVAIKYFASHLIKLGIAQLVDAEDELYMIFLEEYVICVVRKDGSVVFKLDNCEHSLNKYLNHMYSCGLLLVKSTDSYLKYVDKTGKQVSNNVFFSATDFKNDVASVIFKGGGLKDYALIDKNCKPVSNLRFARIGNLQDEAIVVTYDDNEQSMNYIKHNGELLVKGKRFSVCKRFKNGYGVVCGINGFNLVDINGNFVFNGNTKPMGEMTIQDNGLVLISTLIKKNYINIKSKNKILDEDASYSKGFKNGFAAVSFNFNKVWNYIIDNQGNFLFSKHKSYKFCGDFDSTGYAIVISNNGQYNFIDKKGHEVSDIWFDFLYDEKDLKTMMENIYFDERIIYELTPKFNDGYVKVTRKGDGNYNLMRYDGKIVSERWFDDVGNFSGGFAYVKYGEVGNLMDMNGNLLIDYDKDDKDGIEITEDVYFMGGCSPVSNKEKKWNVLKDDGTLLFSEWYKFVSEISDNVYQVDKIIIDSSGKEATIVNFAKKNGEFIIGEWLNKKDTYIDEGYNHVIIKNDKDKWNAISDETADLVLNEWVDYPISYVKDGYYRISLDVLVDSKGQLVSFI